MGEMDALHLFYPQGVVTVVMPSAIFTPYSPAGATTHLETLSVSLTIVMTCS